MGAVHTPRGTERVEGTRFLTTFHYLRLDTLSLPLIEFATGPTMALLFRSISSLSLSDDLKAKYINADIKVLDTAVAAITPPNPMRCDPKEALDWWKENETEVVSDYKCSTWN